MFRAVTKRKVGLLVSIAVSLVTLFVTPLSSLDPINVPKLWVLLALAFAIVGVIIFDLKPLGNKSDRLNIIASVSLLLFMIIAMILSDSPLTQQLFGTFGRNTGLLTYLSFVIIFIGAANATDISIKKPFVLSFSIAAGFNAIYGFVQAIGKDPQKWSNPYTPVIGTLGNPNFVSAFLGLGVALALAYLFAANIKLIYRILAVLYILLATYDILKSDAQQGLIISALSGAIVLYFWLKDRIKVAAIRYLYLFSGLIAFILGVAGTLQKGPLATILYQQSVTYRGDYWQAGLTMLRNNPFFGVGLDSYGDWYRASRTVEATLRRGPSVVSNAAHNVFIDIAATAGIFALVAYLLLIFLGLKAAYKTIKRNPKADPFFIAIFAAWLGYLVQSVISINNIALGIWGWVLPGILISFEKWQAKDETSEAKNLTKAKRKSVSNFNDFSGMGLVGGLIIGGTIGFLPFNSDANFRHSMEEQNIDNIFISASKWPAVSDRLNFATKIFDQNQLQDKALLLARESVAINPRNFDGWNFLYNSNSVSADEKREILIRLKALDPHNPDLAKLG